jgi:hypothetical protein
MVACDDVSDVGGLFLPVRKAKDFSHPFPKKGKDRHAAEGLRKKPEKADPSVTKVAS